MSLQFVYEMTCPQIKLFPQKLVCHDYIWRSFLNISGVVEKLPVGSLMNKMIKVDHKNILPTYLRERFQF